MNQFLLLGYEFLTEFVPFLLALMLVRKRARRPARPDSGDVLLIAFALYVMAVFHVTGAGTVYNALTFRFRGIENRINLVPFSNPIDPVGYLLNIVMFIPFGFLVPLIWRRMRSVSHVAVAGGLFSLLIEASQLLSCRGTDVDDVILNTAGAAVGFFVYRLWDRVTQSKYQPRGAEPKELPIYVLALYLGRCLLFDYLGLMRLLYGF